MVGTLNRIDRYLTAAERCFLGLLTGLLTVILCSQVVLRYGFSRPLFWAEEIAVELLVFMTLFGFSVLLQSRRLIEIDILTNVLPGRLMHGVRVTFQVVGLGVLVVLAWKGATWVLRPEVRAELSPTTGLPLWVNYTLFPVAFWFMAFHQAVGLVNLLRGGGRKEGPC